VGVVLAGVAVLGAAVLAFTGYLSPGFLRDSVSGYSPGNCRVAAQRPFETPSLKGLNYGTPRTASGEWVGTEWLTHWPKTRPALEADLAFIESQNLGRTMRVFIGLDQAMIWDDRRGFVGFHEATLQNFQEALDVFQAHGMKVIAVLYDQEVVGSRGNFRFEALDGLHPAMRSNYLRATDVFLRRFGASTAVIGWDLFNEAYNSLGADGGLPKPPADDPVSPNLSDATVHSWIHDLYRVAKCAAPEASFTVSDTTELYWKDHPDTSKYADSVDFYDLHIYDDQPKLKDWASLLREPVIVGEAGASTDQNHFADQRINPDAVRFLLDHARQAGFRAVLAHDSDQNIYPKDRSTITATGRVLASFSG
jgi:hypothetical protein